MPIQTITMSSASVPGASGAAATNWRSAEPMSASIFVSTTGTSSGNFTFQYTLDDLQLVGGSSRALWQGFSSAINQAGMIFSTSSVTADGIFFPFQTPVAAVRINSTAMSSGPLIMKVLQGEGG